MSKPLTDGQLKKYEEYAGALKYDGRHTAAKMLCMLIDEVRRLQKETGEKPHKPEENPCKEIRDGVIRHKIQKPDYRNNGEYQFVVGYTAGGAEECQHLSPEKIAERCSAKVGKGTLVDDGVDLWWEQVLPLNSHPNPVSVVDVLPKTSKPKFSDYKAVGAKGVAMYPEEGFYVPFKSDSDGSYVSGEPKPLDDLLDSGDLP